MKLYALARLARWLSLRRVLITGATGCVGHYVVEALLAREDCHLVLLARDPRKMRLGEATRVNGERVEWIVDDICSIDAYKDRLTDLDAVVHIATAWGDPVSYPVNVDATLALAEFTDAERCAFLYFSTASILDEHTMPLPLAEQEGTDYIRSKFLAHQALRAGRHARRVTTLFPTIVFGGSPRHPYSHASLGLTKLVRALWAMRWLTFDGSMHYIHAQDIARVVSHLLDHPRPGVDLVLGNPAATVDGLIDQLCEHFALPRRSRLDLTPVAGAIERLAGSRMTSWDRACFKQRHFCYDAINPRALGLSPGYESLSLVLAELQRLGPAALPLGVS